MTCLKNLHVAHVTTAHSADDVRIFHRQAKLLVPCCNRVTIVASNCEGNQDGVEFVSWGKRAPQTRGERVRAATMAVEWAEAVGADLYHFHDPELMLPMRKLARKLKVPVIYDIHEHYRGTLCENSGGGLVGFAAARTYGLAERFALRALAGVVTVTPQILAMYVDRVRRTALVRNLPDTEEIFALTARRDETRRNCRLVYSGSVEQRALYPLAQAVRLLKERFPSLSVRIVGDFRYPSDRERLKDHWRAVGVVDRLDLVDRMPRQAFIASLEEDAIGLVLFWPTPNARVALPNKLFEYMASGLPVVVPDLPNQRAVVEENACGVWCDTTNALSIAGAIAKLLEDPQVAWCMGNRGRKACQTTYRADADLPVLTALYENCWMDFRR